MFSVCLSLSLSFSLSLYYFHTFTFIRLNVLCLLPLYMLSVRQAQGFKVWFYVGFVNLVRVFVAVHSRGMAATLATRGRSTSRKRAARIWLISRRHVCPARWTSSPPTTKVYSALTSVCAPLCPSTQMRWSNTHRFTRPPTMGAGERCILLKVCIHV